MCPATYIAVFYVVMPLYGMPVPYKQNIGCVPREICEDYAAIRQSIHKVKRTRTHYSYFECQKLVHKTGDTIKEVTIAPLVYEQLIVNRPIQVPKRKNALQEIMKDQGGVRDNLVSVPAPKPKH